MIATERHGMLGRRLWALALIGAMLAVAAAGPSAALGASATQHHRARAAQQTQPAINAKTDPDAAAAAINAGGSASAITWQTDTASGGCADAQPAPAPPVQQAPCVPTNNNQDHYTIADGWGTPFVFGDVLYNCGQVDYAETDTGTSDSQSVSWSLAEKVSLKIGVGVPGIASVSDEVSAFSKQANQSATAVIVKFGDKVAPGFKGWTTAQVKTITIPGSASVADSVRNTVTPVDDIDLTFPGWKVNPAEAEQNLTGHANPMTAAETNTICNTNPANSSLRGLRVVGAGATVRKPSRFALRVCGPTGRCGARTVAGTLPPARIRRATARLTRAGHVVGRGTYTRGRTAVHVRRALRPGRYRLTLRETPRRVRVGALHAIETTVPVTVR